MLANAMIQNAISSALKRDLEARMSAARRTRVRSWLIRSGSFRRRTREQALRPPDQHHDHDDVDDERAELRRVILAGDVAEAEQQRGDERPGDARGAADGDHDQKVDHEFERELRVEAEDLGAERAAEARK